MTSECIIYHVHGNSFSWFTHSDQPATSSIPEISSSSADYLSLLEHPCPNVLMFRPFSTFVSWLRFVCLLCLLLLSIRCLALLAGIKAPAVYINQQEKRRIWLDGNSAKYKVSADLKHNERFIVLPDGTAYWTDVGPAKCNLFVFADIQTCNYDSWGECILALGPSPGLSHVLIG